MALRDIKPTRSELINLKRRIVLSERGYKILKMKRDGLIIEFFKVLEKAKDSQSDLQQKYERATQMMAFANTVEGAIGVKSAA
ncbi:MAG TPA: V-type ATP synthase subunit D, partial [Methanoregulaceae archaeon]|nr:V-type ATP synthase subunit D [Methanoregulaceae archaeon]